MTSALGDDGPSIGIVGAGIGGLTLAACLSRRGYRVEVFEQAAAFERVGAGIMLAPNAVKALAGIDLGHALDGSAVVAPTLRNRAWDTGELLFELPLGEGAEATYGAPFLLAHRGDLHTALRRAVPSECVTLHARLVDVEPNGDGVQLIFADGTRKVVDMVVGADGIHSVVRGRLFTQAAANFTGRVAYRTVYPSSLAKATGLAPSSMSSTKWWGPDRHLVIYYISAGRELYFTTSVPDNDWTTESWSARGSLEDLKDAFAGFHPEVQAVIEACPSVHKWAIYDRDPLPDWHTRNAVLLGDACHPMTPYMAQGAATSMEDAVVLSRCIEKCGAGDEAFGMYEAARRARATLIQTISRSNTWLQSETDPTPVYGYDAWSVSLDGPHEMAEGNDIER